jgi:hypothetical protein
MCGALPSIDCYEPLMVRPCPGPKREPWPCTPTTMRARPRWTGSSSWAGDAQVLNSALTTVSPPGILNRRQWLDNARGRNLVIDDMGKVTEYRVQMKVTVVLDN